MPMSPTELEHHLLEKLNALPPTENRLLYDIDYDEKLVIGTAKTLLAHNPFPLLPRLSDHRLTVLAAFASAMADDEYAEMDSFYNRLSELFFGNAPLDVSKQNGIRDFVEETCDRYNLRFLRNQNRLVRNTIWLHGGLPSRHWSSFFERVLIPVDDSLSNLDNLLNPPTPRTIKRFFDLCGDSAKTFLRDCIEMRDALSQPDEDTFSAEDFGVSDSFFIAFKEFLNRIQQPAPQQRATVFFDHRSLTVINSLTGNAALPKQQWYAFRTNSKFISRCQTELPKSNVILVYHNDFSVSDAVPRYIERETLFGAWSNYNCEWLNVNEQTSLTLAHRDNAALSKTLDVVSTPSVSLIGEKLMLNNRAVCVKHQGEELDVYTALPSIAIEDISDNALSRVRFYINGERRDISPARTIALSQLNLLEGVYTIHLRGARGLDAIQFAYLPNLKLRLDKTEYRANELSQLFINKAPQSLPANEPRPTIPYNGFSLVIPIPLFAWRLTDANFTSEPLSLSADKLPNMQGEKHLEIYCGNRGKTHTTLHFKRDEEIIERKVLRLNDSYVILDLANYRDIANVNTKLDFIFTIGNDVIPVLRTYKEWNPQIQSMVDGTTVTLTIQDNAEGFKNRELVFWNLCRLWEKPLVLSVPDGANTLTHTFQHEGECGVQARVKQSDWGKPKELSPFDVPALFNSNFQIGTVLFENFLESREQILLDVLITHLDLPIVENEFIAVMAYLLKAQERDVVRKWIHLFLALPEGIRNRFQAALYSETHDSVKNISRVYEQMISGMVNANGYVTQFHIVQRVNVELKTKPYRQNEYDGFMLNWETDAGAIRMIGIPNGNNLQRQGQRFVQTDSLKFYTLIAKRDNAFAIATVAIAREPLIVCFQAVQLDNARFKLIWNVLNADEVELSTSSTKERVALNGTKEIQPMHGQEFTLAATAHGKEVPHKLIKTEFIKPHIEKFESTEMGDNTVIVSWKTHRADSVVIEPNIGIVEQSGEREITIQQLHSGIRLIATNKGGDVEKLLKIDSELPDWFKRDEYVKIELENHTFYAKVKDVFFCKSGELMFAKTHTVNFEILYSRANRVYVKLSGDVMPSALIELSFCRNQQPLSNLEDLIKYFLK